MADLFIHLGKGWWKALVITNNAYKDPAAGLHAMIAAFGNLL